MNRNRIAYALITALAGTLALAGCKKPEEPAATTPPAATEPAPAPAPAEPAPAPAATASVTAVDLGTEVGADMKVTTPATTFKPTDTIHASVSTATSDPAATVSGTLGAKWTFEDGQTVNEESKDFNLAGAGATDFSVSKPDGLPAGKYKVEISLDGAVVQSKDFEVK